MAERQAYSPTDDVTVGKGKAGAIVRTRSRAAQEAREQDPREPGTTEQAAQEQAESPQQRLLKIEKDAWAEAQEILESVPTKCHFETPNLYREIECEPIVKALARAYQAQCEAIYRGSAFESAVLAEVASEAQTGARIERSQAPSFPEVQRYREQEEAADIEIEKLLREADMCVAKLKKSGVGLGPPPR